jgi:3-oxoadipate enol-lactonase
MKSEINGAEIAYEQQGQGPAVLFIHAGIADRSMWDYQFEYFSRGQRVIRPDLRGFGESNLPSMPFANHEDVHALLDQLGVGQTTVVGISMGGDVALDFVLEYPERVSKLVLCSTLAAMDEPSAELSANWAAAEAAFERGEVDKATDVEVEGWIIGTGRSNADVDPQFVEKATRMIRGIWNRVLEQPQEVEERELDPPRKERLSEISVPTLLIRGDCDFPDVQLSIDRLHREIKGSELSIIPNSSHLPPLEQPVLFNEILERFLAL